MNIASKLEQFVTVTDITVNLNEIVYLNTCVSVFVRYVSLHTELNYQNDFFWK